MAKLLARFVIRGGDVDDYDDLRMQLAARGFVNVVNDGDGKRYKLPWDEYFVESEGNARDVLEEAKQLTSALGFAAHIFVVEYVAFATTARPQ